MLVTPSPPTSTTSIPTVSPLTISPPRQHPKLTRLKTGHLKPKTILDLSVTLSPDFTPTTFNQANKYAVWRTAMSNELNGLLQQQTWTLVPPPADAPILGCRWTYKTKLDPAGHPLTHKARLVSQGSTQEHGVNYHENLI
ncbi:hypothetical protein KFK09_000539 [Dendrobium nobile]|uniref:Reverse transcriptase Ty1/copia-type domain-containing protein n=1 Tax=Dendrobium nobile TaxID=94219 RepID=A0A8T3CF71_DENNO|nr:hypothetical protein KFK09_000539 [Dendrobium nobile]